MPVKIDMTAKDWDAINQMEKDYKILYEALEDISKMAALNYVPRKMKLVAEYALDEVKTIGGE